MIFIVTAYEVLKNFRKLITRGGVWYLWLKKNPKNNKEPLTKSLLILVQNIYPFPSSQIWDQAAI